MSTSKIGQVNVKGEPAFSIAALRRFHRLFWEVGKLATEPNMRFREELLQLLQRTDEGRGFVADLVTFQDFHRICRLQPTILAPVKYVQSTLQNAILGSVFWTTLRKQWEAHLTLCAGRQQPYLPPAAFGGGPGLSYYTPPGAGTSGSIGSTVGSPIGSGQARPSDLHVAMEVNSASLRRRLLTG